MISENKSFPVQYVLCACTCNFMLSSRLQWCIATYNATLTPWTDHFRSRSDDQCKGRLLFLCIASVQQLGPAPFRAPSSSIVTPDNYSSCPARAPGQKNAAMYVHKSSAQSKISKSLHQHWLRSRISHIRTEVVLKNRDGVIAPVFPVSQLKLGGCPAKQ